MYAGGKFKDIKELQQLLAIQKRLQRVMVVVRGGGIENIAKQLKLANKELKKKFPKAKPLTMENLQYAGTRRDGSKDFRFSRFTPGPKGNHKANTYANARVQIPAGGEPKVTVNAKLK